MFCSVFNFICLFLTLLGLQYWEGLSLVVVLGLLIVMASLVAKHRL